MIIHRPIASRAESHVVNESTTDYTRVVFSLSLIATQCRSSTLKEARSIMYENTHTQTYT